MELQAGSVARVEMSAPPQHYRFAAQFIGVFKKNVLLKLAARKQLAFEILYPVYFSVILYVIAGPLHQTSDFLGSCDGVRAQGQCMQTAVPLNPVSSGTCAESTVPGSLLLYSPDTPEASAVIGDVLRLLRSSSSCSLGFETRKKAEAWYTAHGSQNASLPPGRPAIVAGAVYLPKEFEKQRTLSYQLALPPSNHDWCSIYCPQPPPPLAGAALLQSRDYFAEDAMSWAAPLALQWAVTRAIAISRNATLRSMVLGEGNASAMLRPPLLAKLPVPPLSSSYAPTSNEMLQYLFPLYMCLGLTAAIGYVVAMVVNEREKKLLDGAHPLPRRVYKRLP
jgi:hypothetical protein